MKDIKNVISVRLKTLQEKRGVSNIELATATDINKASISQYRSGSREPDAESLVKIAKFFDVSTDYLLGRTDAETNNKDIQFICDYMHLTSDALSKWMEIFEEPWRLDVLSGYDFNKYVKRMNSTIVDDNFFMILNELVRVEDFCDFSIAELNELLNEIKKPIDNKMDGIEIGVHLTDLSLRSADLIMKGNLKIDALLYRINQMTIKIAEHKREKYTKFTEAMQRDIIKKSEELVPRFGKEIPLNSIKQMMQTYRNEEQK